MQSLPQSPARPANDNPGGDGYEPDDPSIDDDDAEEIGPLVYPIAFENDRLDQDVLKVVRRLMRHGHEAYLVGGCVRDLLLGRTPKDFDVATSARPEQVRELFRNSRIIGRRFRLVHVLFHGGKVIEVATFRRKPRESIDEGEDSPEELLIRSDNAFGEAEEDAARRDFTINGLFYDPAAGEILDWVGGVEDVRRRVVNTIGDPETRFREDPVRILRAIKFAGRLDLGIDPNCYDAMVLCRDSLELAARPRLSEEILRLMRGGQARRSIYLAWELGVLDVLLPELSSLIYDAAEEPEHAGRRVFRLLASMDAQLQQGVPLSDTELWTLLLLEPLKEACDGVRDRGAAAADFLEPIVERLAVPRRVIDGMRRIIAVLPKVRAGRAGRFARTELFETAFRVARADLMAHGESLQSLEKLKERAGSPAPAKPRRR